MSGVLKKIKNTSIYIVVRAILALLTLLPLRLSYFLLKLIAIIACYLPIKENRIARNNLRLFYDGNKAREIMKAMYNSWAISIAEIIEVVFKKRDVRRFAHIDDVSKKILDEALKEGRGVIFITAHLGNWEIMAIRLASEGYDINTIAKESYDPRFTEMLHKLREKNGVKCIFRGESDVMRKIKDVLNRNGVMGFLIDQNTKVTSINVEFLGKEAPTPVVPIRLLKESGAALIVGYNHRVDGRVLIEMERINYSINEDEKEILKRINDILSREIMKYPYEWIWIHNRWNIS